MRSARPDETEHSYAGFCLAGYMRAVPEAVDPNDPSSDPRTHRRLIAADARLTRRMGGNLLRCFWSFESVLAGPTEDLAVALNSVLRGDLNHRAVFLHDLDHRVAKLDRANAVLDELRLAVEGRSESRFALDFSLLDALFDGLDDANRDDAEPVGLVLALVSAPPRWIIEAPSDVTLQRIGRPYTFASLWHRYVCFHAELHRRLVIRYVAERPQRSLRALEIANEPDYNWTPEEVKIEGAREELVNPVGKYVTELHLGQLPLTDRGQESFEVVPWGFQHPDAAWTERNRPPIGVLEFDWGPKFDWYTMCAAQVQTHASRAIKEEAQSHGADILTVSGSVTHNNVDYLVRMHRADQAAFEHIDRIGLHPYHWVDNNVWNGQFVSGEAFVGWPRANPRTYATSYFKRFDFLAAFGADRDSGDPSIDAELMAVFGDRKLWLTEFGIGTKILQGVNALDPGLTRYIRPRGLVGASAGHADVVWEDLWQAFVDQVDAPWLREHDVDCLMIYGLRELDRWGFDLHDDDRSNLALFRRDQTPRLDSRVLGRVSGLMQELSRLSAGAAPTPAGPPVPPELYRRPWRSVALSDRARKVNTMLSLEERQLLQWLTSSYYGGAGAIVDGGCFVGGSTVPLAEGLQLTGEDAVVDVYDRFEAEAYMNDFYFKGEGRSAGESFLPVFKRNTEHVSDRLRVHVGDLMSHPWGGGPIEILFVDVSKTWQLNDFIVEQFFPSLIPGNSIVVQQDFVYAGCPWVPLTMEHLQEYFEPVGFAEYSSTVYLCRAQVPRDIAPVSSIPHEVRMELMDQAIARFRGYPRDVLECAKATLLVERGDHKAVQAILDRISADGSKHNAVRAALDLVAAFR